MDLINIQFLVEFEWKNTSTDEILRHIVYKLLKIHVKTPGELVPHAVHKKQNQKLR